MCVKDNKPAKGCTKDWCNGNGECILKNDEATCKCEKLYNGKQCDSCRDPMYQYPDCT